MSKIMNWVLSILLVGILGFGTTVLNTLSHEIESKDKEYEDLRTKYNDLVNESNAREEELVDKYNKLVDDYNKLVENPISTIFGLNKNNN